MIDIDTEIARSKRDHDIHLNNVVVCQSDEKNDEVLQYNLRKTKIEDKLKLKNFLNMSSQTFLTALINLQA
jgi:hypothetical protein